METPVQGKDSAETRVLGALTAAIAAVGTGQHVDRLIDLIGALAAHDRVTVVRYSATERPEFLSHRNYSAAMVRKYLETYYVYDPFYAFWRRRRKPGVVALRNWPGPGPYVSEFLDQSAIADELGVLLNDGPGWCLGIFLDRARHRFTDAEIARLEARFAVFAAIHDLDLKSREPGFKRTSQPAAAGREPVTAALLPDGLWSELTARERQIAQLILAGNPTSAIARKLAITVGTTKNHRRRIYEKLDITSERELFLQYLNYTHR